MLPKNTLGRKMLSKLKVYAGPHAPAPGAAAGAVRDHPGLSAIRRVGQCRSGMTTERADQRSARKTTWPSPPAAPETGAGDQVAENGEHLSPYTHRDR